MSVSSSTAKTGPLACNGSLTAFPSGAFRILAADEITVTLTDSDGVETTLTLTTHYTIAPTGSSYPADSFTVNTVATYDTGYKITITRNNSFTQGTSYGKQGPFDPQIHETDFDRAVLRDQEIKEEIDRCLQIEVSDETTSTDATQYVIDINAAADAAAASAAAASTSESNAGTSESNAASSETNAGTSETNAAASAASISAVLPLTGTTGDVLYWNGSAWTALPKGSATDVLTQGASIPQWGAQGAPGAHNTTHQNGGADEISVAGLSGELADDQPTVTAKIGMAADDKMIARISGTVQEVDLTTAGRALLDDANAAAQRTTLGLGDSATKNVGTGAGTVAEGDDSRFDGIVSTALGTANMLYIEDQKANGTDGGGSSAATQNVRVLNTKVVDNISGASLSSNQVTLPAGTYWVEFDAPATTGVVSNSRHKLRLRNTSDASTPVVGSSEFSSSNDDESMTRSVGSGLFVIAGTKVFELQHYTQTALAVYGLGEATSSGDIEVYARIKIWKVA